MPIDKTKHINVNTNNIKEKILDPYSAIQKQMATAPSPPSRKNDFINEHGKSVSLEGR